MEEAKCPLFPFFTEEQEAVLQKPQQIMHDFRHTWNPLQNAYPLELTPFTTFTRDFTGCLDYIFYDPRRLAVSCLLDLPSAEVLSAQAGTLPNQIYPSDHLALLAEFQFLCNRE